MNERMESVSSRGAPRQQKTPLGADHQEETVNPSLPEGGPSASPARPGDPPREVEDQRLMERVVSRHNMIRAYERVKSNAGAPGVDGMTVEELMPYLREQWAGIRDDLLGDVYRPQPVRRVKIPKSNGGVRLLGVPTVVDRLIQQALLQVLTPLIDPEFADESYGFRPGRSAHDAARAARSHMDAGYRWVVDMDLEKFFDRVNHDVLMSRVARRIRDKRVLRLIRRYLQSGVMINGVVVSTEEGTPQGGPLSPLLANILLDDLDCELRSRGHRFVRYADDVNVYVRSKRAGERVLESLKQWLGKNLRLRVNEEKSGVRPASRSKFLGLSFYRSPRGWRIRLAPSSLKRLKERLRRLTSRNWGVSLRVRIGRLNEYSRGWLGYFSIADMKGPLRDVDQWLRRRLRACVWVQWKRVRTRWRKLRDLGVPDWKIHLTANSRRGPWFMAGAPLNSILDLDYWRKQDLMFLTDRYLLLRQRT